MSLVFSGVCSHAPGITGRSERADPALREPFFAAFGEMRDALQAARPDALIVVAAEHFANFFMNNMPSYALGMCEAITARSKIRPGSASRTARCAAMPACRGG